ncbi:MAG: vacuolar protein sorting-associated protein 1 [Chaenotheca gracillima]|nr:MAG: vacuolar protein sorting-associated protein 1 [Chaenotheca gracillima]
MPFRFTYFCDLLEQLEDYATRDPPLLPKRQDELSRKAIQLWFQSHRLRIDASDSSPAALLSALFPERRTDRVYALREKTLVKLLGRVLEIGASRRAILEQWTEAGAGDLGERVQFVQRQAEMPIASAGREVTIEEVDVALTKLAARCRFSSIEVRKAGGPRADPESVLSPIFHRLQSREAKWFTRMILKSYLPVVLPEQLVLKQFHFLLPDLLRFQSSFDAAAALLRGPVIGSFPASPRHKLVEARLRKEAKKELCPKVGVKVGRVNFLKARSIKHCIQMAAGRTMSLERKYDGEYCQIHIDLTKGSDWLKIFSKSGKESTKDRSGIHDALQKCLRIGSVDCMIKQRCILEGELVVFSDKEGLIMPFRKLRKHLPRSGTYLGASKDSPTYDFEHLMLVFYDILLLDDQTTLNEMYNDRMMTLNDVVSQQTGKAVLAWRQPVDFSSRESHAHLKRLFARGIAAHWEGFVLKPTDQPYLNLESYNQSVTKSWIKLKKDYIKGLGDTADFAVVGAGFDARSCRQLDLRNARWTHFHLGCLENKEDVLRFDKKPRFRVIEAIDRTISKSDRKIMDQLGLSRWEPYSSAGNANFELRMEDGLACKMDVVFREPFVLELMGGGFDRPADKTYSTLRWPRVVKVHEDRSIKETVSFAELQEMAEASEKASDDYASQDERDWIDKLEHADPKGSWTENSHAEDETFSARTTSGSETELPSPISGSSNPRHAVRLSVLARTKLDELTCTVTADAEATALRTLRGLTRSLPTPPKSSPDDPPNKPTRGRRKPVRLESADQVRAKRKAEISALRLSPENPAKRPKIRIQHLSAPGRLMSPSVEQAPAPRNARPSLPLLEITNPRILPNKPQRTHLGKPENTTEIFSPVERRSSIAQSLTLKEPTTPRTFCPPMSTRCIHTLANTSTAAATSNSTPPGRSPCKPSAISCFLQDSIVLLSPCINQMPYLTSDLLPSHGIPFLGCSYAFLDTTLYSLTKKRIVLVETHRTKPTATFLREVRRRKGVLAKEVSSIGEDDTPCVDHRQDKEAETARLPAIASMEVYDWRLLECIDKIERDRTRAPHPNMRRESTSFEKHESEEQRQHRVVGFDFWKRCHVTSL